MSAVPGFIVIVYCSSCFVAEVGVATGRIGTSRWNGSNGVEAAERTYDDVFFPLIRAFVSKSNEQTSASVPAPLKPRVRAERRVIGSLSQFIARVPCP